MRYQAQRALGLLREGTGRPNAEFREGQEQAIRHLVEGRGRLLMVEKTGWGKSFVYFIAAKLLRESGSGRALLISPLLALMRNQIAAAEGSGAGWRAGNGLSPRPAASADGGGAKSGAGRGGVPSADQPWD